MNMTVSSGASPIKGNHATIEKGNLNKSNRNSITNNILQANNSVLTFSSIKKFINAKNNNTIDTSNINQINIKNREYKIQEKDGKVEIIKSKQYRKFDCIKHFLEKCKADHFSSVKKDIKSMNNQKNHIKNIMTPEPYGQSAATSMKASTIPLVPIRPAPPVPTRALTQTAPVELRSSGIPTPPPLPPNPQKVTVSSEPALSQKTILKPESTLTQTAPAELRSSGIPTPPTMPQPQKVTVSSAPVVNEKRQDMVTMLNLEEVLKEAQMKLNTTVNAYWK